MTSHEGIKTKCSDKGGGESASALQLLLIKVLSGFLMSDIQNMRNHRLFFPIRNHRKCWSIVIGKRRPGNQVVFSFCHSRHVATAINFTFIFPHAGPRERFKEMSVYHSVR